MIVTLKTMDGKKIKLFENVEEVTNGPVNNSILIKSKNGGREINSLFVLEKGHILTITEGESVKV